MRPEGIGGGESGEDADVLEERAAVVAGDLELEFIDWRSLRRILGVREAIL